MKNVYSMVKSLTYTITIASILTSCIFGGGNPNSSNPGSASTVTGLEWNVDEEDGGSFQVSEYAGQPVGPNLVFIEAQIFQWIHQKYLKMIHLKLQIDNYKLNLPHIQSPHV